MTNISQNAVVEAFNRLLAPGDEVLIHSSLKNLGYFEAGVDAILEALCASVGADSAQLGDDMVHVFRARCFDACCMRALEEDPDIFIDKKKEALKSASG